MKITLDSNTDDPVLFSAVLSVFNEWYAASAAADSPHFNDDRRIALTSTLEAIEAQRAAAPTEAARLQTDTDDENAARTAFAGNVPGAPAAPSTAAVVQQPTVPVPPAPPAPPTSATPSPPGAPPAPAPTASVPDAPSSPPAPPSRPAGSVEVDKNGLPWDERIHAGTRAKVADGTWKYKRGAMDTPEQVKAVEDELRKLMALPAPVAQQPVAPQTPPASVFASPTPPATPTPAVPPMAPVTLPTDFQQFMTMFTELMKTHPAGINGETGKAAAVANGLPTLAGLAIKPEHAANVARTLLQMADIPFIES